MKNLFVHCGLHKTGTTALQAFLASNREWLAAQGFYYPRGYGSQYLNAHHNLAWQLSRDRRFDSHLGSIELFYQELGSCKTDIVISSEDFESSLYRRDIWQEVSKQAGVHGYELVFIIYHRQPVSYAESLYLENLKHGYGSEFNCLVRDIIRYGWHEFNEWVFCFDLLPVDTALTGLGRIEYRDYHHLYGRTIEQDFLELVGIRTLPKKFNVELKNNRRSVNWYLKLFARNRSGNGFWKSEDKTLYLGVDALVGNSSIELVVPKDISDNINSAVKGNATLKTNVRAYKYPEFSRNAIVNVEQNDSFSIDMNRLFSQETFQLIKAAAIIATKIDQLHEESLLKLREDFHGFVSLLQKRL
jgi:hypothetical protein